MTNNLPHIEHAVLVPLRNPKTNRKHRRWMYAGAIDRVEGKRIVDWKSAGDVARFADKKAVGFQPECYAIALRELGVEVEEYEYRVIQTPSIRFSRVDGGDPAAYEERCLEWLREDGRTLSMVVPITEGAIHNARRWLWEVAMRIDDAMRRGFALHNEAACDSFNKPCPYIQLCKRLKDCDDVAPAIDAFYELLKQSHQELPPLPAGTDYRDVLTYSAAAMFSLCEQRYVWRYQLGLVPKKEDTAESLYIGSAMHKGLEKIDGPIEQALEDIEEYRRKVPCIGALPESELQSIARAKAMVRRAKEVWG